MEFFFVVVVIAAAIVVVAGKKKPRSRYRKRQSPTWKEPTSRTPDVQPTPQPSARSAPNSKIAPDGFRYDPDGEWPFLKRKLITDTEQILFDRLRQALPGFHIFTQVQLSQLVTIKKGHSFKMWFARINQMSVDFIITDQSLNTIAAIELDDKTHYSDEDRHRADAKKDKALTAAGIRIIRWRCEIMPSVEQIELAFPEYKVITKETDETKVVQAQKTTHQPQLPSAG